MWSPHILFLLFFSFLFFLFASLLLSSPIFLMFSWWKMAWACARPPPPLRSVDRVLATADAPLHFAGRRPRRGKERTKREEKKEKRRRKGWKE